MLVRPRVPVWYILVGVVGVILATAIIWRWWRPSAHIPTAEAQNWYAIGTNALRDGAFYQASKALERAITIDGKYVLAHARLAESLIELDYIDRAKDELLGRVMNGVNGSSDGIRRRPVVACRSRVRSDCELSFV